ncbi:hypothetical protein D9M73_169840 [compost metagenome]
MDLLLRPLTQAPHHRVQRPFEQRCPVEHTGPPLLKEQCQLRSGFLQHLEPGAIDEDELPVSLGYG